MAKQSDLEWILSYLDRILTGTAEDKLSKIADLVKECKAEIGME
jgi:hypothetical protein